MVAGSGLVSCLPSSVVVHVFTVRLQAFDIKLDCFLAHGNCFIHGATVCYATRQRRDDDGVTTFGFAPEHDSKVQ
jgi:hypothetical protein